MNRLILLIILLVAAAESHAYSISGSLQFLNNKGVVTITGFSSRFDVFVHQLETAARIKEEGQTVDADSRICTKPVDDITGLPLDLYCIETATDTTLTDTCYYCGAGSTEAFSFALVSLGSKAWQDCRVYNAGPGGW